jgi:drug/metabolite transporter (DMT)-like permease
METSEPPDMAWHRFFTGYMFVLAATVIWSGNFIVARTLANAVQPITLVIFRSIIALVLLIPFTAGAIYRERALIRKHFAFLAVTAFFGITVCNTLLYVAALTSTALNLSLIAVTSPIFTLALARIFLRDTLTLRRVIGFIGATFGVVLLITDGQLSRLMELAFTHGDLWMLGQAASFALYSILVRKKPAEMSPLVFLFTLFFLGGVLFLLPALPWEIPHIRQIDFTPSVIESILYLGIGPSLLAFLCWNQSVAIVGPTRAALVYYCLPLFSGFEAFLLLGEPINAIHIISAILILSGVIIATRE